MDRKNCCLFIFTQHLKLDSFTEIVKKIPACEEAIFLTTQFLFENERAFLCTVFPKCIFHTFADFLTDAEMAKCDEDAYIPSDREFSHYEDRLRKQKNEIVSQNFLKKYAESVSKMYLLSTDLGIDADVWEAAGCQFVEDCQYYYVPEKVKVSLVRKLKGKLSSVKMLKNAYRKITRKKLYTVDNVYVGNYEEKKYVFLGNLNRIGYRLNIDFVPSQEECDRLNQEKYETKENCVYLTTWHERWKSFVPDDSQYALYWMQDGYIPNNYSDYDYFFKPDNAVYYCWDTMSTKLFENRGLPYEIIPFRKKLYIPEPEFPQKVANILIVASGSGDWTAMKNRSDDDILVHAFAQMAKRFPQIRFTYRCHPTWILPRNVGVNAINRVNDYFKSLKLNNLFLSSNIPLANLDSGIQLSFSRSSLDEDLANADFVFGEHSISMIDAAFKKIPFCSVNLTNRRNFFVGVNDLGFPTCSTLEEIENLINHITDSQFQDDYKKAVANYNQMTDE